jgi:hypothetical protein
MYFFSNHKRDHAVYVGLMERKYFLSSIACYREESLGRESESKLPAFTVISNPFSLKYLGTVS